MCSPRGSCGGGRRGGGGRTADRDAALATAGAVPVDRGDACPPTSRGAGRLVDRGQCALCAKRIQELLRKAGGLRRRSDERGRADPRVDPRLPRGRVRRHHPGGAGRRLPRRDVVVHRYPGARADGRLRQLLPGGIAVGATVRLAASTRTTRAGCGSAWRTGVIQETEEIPAKSEACVAAGLPPIDKVVFNRQDDLVAALIAGRDRRDVGGFTGDGVRRSRTAAARCSRPATCSTPRRTAGPWPRGRRWRSRCGRPGALDENR